MLKLQQSLTEPSAALVSAQLQHLPHEDGMGWPNSQCSTPGPHGAGTTPVGQASCAFQSLFAMDFKVN